MLESAVAAGLELLQQLLRIESTPKAGRETEAARLLLEHARRHNLTGQVLEPVRGSGSFLLRLTTDRTPRILLHSHLDVADTGPAADWTVPPFSGSVVDGYVWGRGAVDLKGLVAAHFAAMLALNADPAPPPVLMAAAAEEECAGRNGTAWLVRNHPDVGRCTYALGEGGGWILELGSRRFMTIQTGEKGSVRFLVSAGSDNAITPPRWYRSQASRSAMAAASRIVGLPAPALRLLPVRSIAALVNRAQAIAPFRVDIEGMLAHGCEVSGNLGGRMAVTCRPLPGTSAASMVRTFCRRTRTTLLELDGAPIEAAESPLEPDARSAIESATACALVPIITGGPSDNHWLREAGITTFGLFPGPSAADVMRIHHADERLSLTAFEYAVHTLTSTVRRLAALAN